MRIDHIVWDWNGTLFDDGDALVQATIDAFAAAGLSTVTRAPLRQRSDCDDALCKESRPNTATPP